MSKPEDYVVKASRAHTTLTLFATIVGILESSNTDISAHKTALKIIRLCKMEQGRQLRRYDSAVQKAKEPAAR